MQIWTTYHEGEIEEALFNLSKETIKYAMIITAKNGDVLAVDQYDAAATYGKGERIQAFIRIPEILQEDGELFFDLEHTQLDSKEIEKLVVCDKWISEVESPAKYLKPGMSVHVKRMDTGDVYEGKLTIVSFLDIVIRTKDEEVSVPVGKIRSMIIL